MALSPSYPPHLRVLDSDQCTDMAAIEYKNCMHTNKQKVITKEKGAVRGIVDNHIRLKNRQNARIRLGKKRVYVLWFAMGYMPDPLIMQDSVQGGISLLFAPFLMAMLDITLSESLHEKSIYILTLVSFAHLLSFTLCVLSTNRKTFGNLAGSTGTVPSWSGLRRMHSRP